MSTYDEQAGDDREGLRRNGLGRDGVTPDETAAGEPATDGLAHDDLVSDDLVGDPAVDGLGRDDLEGGYTDVDEEVPHVRTVHGQYTETAEYPGPETVTEGSYVDRDGSEEVLAADEQGEYTEADHTETARRTRRTDDLPDDDL